jgi:tRNA A-37 threonylcarbamoyl transferase component Bud32
MSPEIASPSAVYAIGSTLKVSPANQTTGIDNLSLPIRIRDHIFVEFGRASQLFVVEVLDGTLPKVHTAPGPQKYVVKLFDPRYAKPDDERETPEACCTRLFHREVECYRRLESLQGLHVPILHGTYSLQISEKQSIPLFVMQHLAITTLLDFFFDRLSAEQLTHVAGLATSALTALHSNNVCHNDIWTGNIMWALGGDRVWFVDFGNAVWPDIYPGVDMAYHRSHDDVCLRGSLGDIGWIDPSEPKILAPSCTEIKHFLRQCNCDFGGDDTNS